VDRGQAQAEGAPQPSKADGRPRRQLEKTNDPVRMYLREMGTVKLLDREGEVDIAQSIEAGEAGSSSRCPRPRAARAVPAHQRAGRRDRRGACASCSRGTLGSSTRRRASRVRRGPSPLRLPQRARRGVAQAQAAPAAMQEEWQAAPGAWTRHRRQHRRDRRARRKADFTTPPATAC